MYGFLVGSAGRVAFLDTLHICMLSGLMRLYVVPVMHECSIILFLAGARSDISQIRLPALDNLRDTTSCAFVRVTQCRTTEKHWQQAS